ncbi:MAG: LacI family DNA-binding transcriptional regulator [Ilumatobacteraceae bacterium]
MAPRLSDIATKVGVSEATVSRVLNNKSGVSTMTREAVLSAVDVLGYARPAQLRTERVRLVGLVLPELQSPIFPAFAEVVAHALAQQGFTPVLCTRTQGGITEAEYVDLLIAQQVSGVVFAGGLYAQADANHDHYARLAERNLPVVLVNAAVDSLQFATVACDDSSAAEQALNHLVSLGHTRIGMVLGPRDHVPSQRKLSAAKRMASAGRVLLTDDSIARADFTIESGQAAAAKLLRRGVTGVICASDPLALGVIQAARKAGLSVPADVSVVGYDDSRFMRYTDPALTTLRQPIEAMGRAVVEHLVAQIIGSSDAGDRLLFEPELIVRASTGRAPTPASR